MVNRSQAPRGSPPLRDYQQDTVDKMLRYEGRAALCVLGTGLGKTRILPILFAARWNRTTITA